MSSSTIAMVTAGRSLERSEVRRRPHVTNAPCSVVNPSSDPVQLAPLRSHHSSRRLMTPTACALPRTPSFRRIARGAVAPLLGFHRGHDRLVGSGSTIAPLGGRSDMGSGSILSRSYLCVSPKFLVDYFEPKCRASHRAGFVNWVTIERAVNKERTEILAANSTCWPIQPGKWYPSAAFSFQSLHAPIHSARRSTPVENAPACADRARSSASVL